jgi:GntR family transcriptional regulator/MocR family aminotransferase
LAGPDVPAADGVVVNFGAPADHAFGAAIDALCEVLAYLNSQPLPV